ncbi:MAG: hypothetical protein ACFFA7_11110 [Promethearchaeota archaeon]
MANSPFWMQKVLRDYHHKKKNFDLSDSLHIINGGGGWDGT